MPELTEAKEPFIFYTRLHLSELTGLKAGNLPQLLEIIKEAPGSCIYHHTHRFLQQHQYLNPEPPNDFAFWVSSILGEEELGEKLASIDTIQFPNIRSLREKIIETIEIHLSTHPKACMKFADAGDEFYFIKSLSFVTASNYTAHNLADFADILGKITVDSIYYHVFESRLRLEKPTNDFSNWMETSIGDKVLAMEISRLDPYTYTLDDLRKTLIKIIRKRVHNAWH